MIRLERRSLPGPVASDVARADALARGVSRGLEPETLRIYRPAPAVSFGPRDAVASGYAAAAEAARAHGFAVVERRAGGRPVAFHEQTLICDWTTPDPEPRAHVHERFEEAAAILCAALRRLGADARVGEIPGEYCPGRYSVNARGSQKVAGLAQRLYERSAHVGAAVVVAEEEQLRQVLTPVYRALGLEWDPATAGSVHSEVAAAGWEDVSGAIVEAFAERFRLVEA